VEGDEGRGAIFMFDRASLAADYKLLRFRDPIVDDETYPDGWDEAEEVIRCFDVVDISKYLVDVAWLEECSLNVRYSNTMKKRVFANFAIPRSERPSTGGKIGKHRRGIKDWRSISPLERSAITNIR
jgi:hypothetical protein